VAFRLTVLLNSTIHSRLPVRYICR